MTHPDPYIKEVMEEFDKTYPLETTADHVSPDTKVLLTERAEATRENLKDFIRTALEAQKSATKTQRIKDIEEIEAVFHDACNSHDGNPTALQLAAQVQLFITSRKAAIEEV